MAEDVLFCSLGAQLAESSFFKTVLIIKMCTCILGTAGSAYVIKTQGIRWLVHPNAKVLFALHLFLATYVPIFFFVHMIFDFWRLSRSSSDLCAYTIPIPVAFWIRFFGAVGNITQSYTMLTFAVERIITTLYPKTYETLRQPTMGIFLGTLAVTFSFSHIFVLLVRPNTWKGVGIVTSLVTRDNKENYSVHLNMMMCLEIITVTLFTSTLVVNWFQRKQKKIGGLGVKYQINETKIVLRSLLPCFWIHFIIFLIPTIAISVRSKMFPPLDEIGTMEWIECFSNYQVYSIVMPIVLIFLRRCHRNRVIVDDHRDMDNHFQQLALMFQ